MGQKRKGRVHGFRPGNHHDVPTRGKQGFMETVDFPETAAGAVAYMSLAQLLAYGNTHPIAWSPVLPGVKHEEAVPKAGGVVQPAKNMIEF